MNTEDASVFDSVAAMSHLFAPRTLADDQFTANWLATYSLFRPRGDGAAAQYEATISYNRLPRLRDIRRPCLVISFSHDMIMLPSEGAAVAAAISRCQHVEFFHCGHFGFLERPDEVTRVLLRFFASLNPVPYRARADGKR
jgi:thioesterase CepJ